jgi:TonB-dependent receptor
MLNKGYRFGSKTVSLLVLLIIIAFQSFIIAQSGSLRGHVFDKENKEPLVGANIIIQGTSLGAAADLSGSYFIANVPAGRHRVVVSYIGYNSDTVSVTIGAGETKSENFYLSAKAIEGRTVVVTAQAQGQRQAINQQLTSNTIVNVVSSEKIHQLPDDNAATALSRLPGVSLMNGDQVVIRGVQAKLNQILLNGIELPSTDMNTRATDLGFISSNLLSGIEVIKALTPDLDANTVGGVVNLMIREAPSGLHFDALAQGNYNATDHVGDNYKFWGSISNRFFNDKLGAFFQVNMDRSDGGNQVASISPTIDGSGSLVYGQATYHTNGANFEYDADIVKNSGGSLILDYKLPNGKIIFQNTYAGNVTDQMNSYVLLNFDNTQAIYTADRDLYGKDLWINALQAENTFGNIKVNVSLSHSATEQYTKFAYSPGLYGAAWSEFYDQTKQVAPFGYNSLGQPITYNSATAERGITLMNALAIFNNLNPTDAQHATIGGWTQSISNQFYQHLYNVSLDVSAPVNFSNNITSIFKAGGKYIRTTRENNIDEYFAHGPSDLYTNTAADNYFGGQALSVANPLRFSQVMNTDFTRGQYYLSNLYNFTNGGFKYVIDPNKYDPWLKLSEQGWAVPLKKDDSWKNDWNGAEQFSAAYLMGTFNIGPRLTLLGGVRYENYNMIYHAQFTFVTHNVYGDAITTENGSITSSPNPSILYHNVPYNAFNVNRTDINYFPDVLLTYKASDWVDLRLAYTTGISRPDYTAIIPKVAVYPNMDYEVGNPMLKPATAQNGDIVATFHNNEIGLFTIDAYYKVIKNQMYSTQIYYGNISRYAGDIFIPDSAFLMNRFGYVTRPQDIVYTSLNNPNAGFIRGVEIDWQTSFWYLPQPLNLLVLDVNYTKSGSNTAYTIIQNNPVQVKQPNGRYITQYITRDTTYIGRLIQQANDVVNVALGADYKGFHARVSFNMIGNVLTGVGIRPEESTFTGNIYRWDMTVKQDLPIDGLSVSLNGVNIFHNGINNYRIYRMTPDAPITKNLVSVLYSPTIWQANIRYSF